MWRVWDRVSLYSPVEIIAHLKHEPLALMVVETTVSKWGISDIPRIASNACRHKQILWYSTFCPGIQFQLKGISFPWLFAKFRLIWLVVVYLYTKPSTNEVSLICLTKPLYSFSCQPVESIKLNPNYPATTLQNEHFLSQANPFSKHAVFNQNTLCSREQYEIIW